MSSIGLWLYRMLTWWLPESRGFAWKRFLLRAAGADIGENVRIYSSALIIGTGKLVLGDDVHIGSGVLLSLAAPAKLMIGNHVDIAPMVTVVLGSHEIDPDGEHIGGMGFAEDVMIGDGSWIGAKATILPGVRLAPKTLVAAGAVVTKSV